MEEDLGEDEFVLNECPGGIHGYISLDWYEPHGENRWVALGCMRADRTPG